MKRIAKQEYTAQFKDQAVAMVKGGKTVAEAARALGLGYATGSSSQPRASCTRGLRTSRPSRWSSRGYGLRTVGSSWRSRS